MVRQIIHIDEEKCNGCGLCAKACHEGAIDMVDGKARLVREHFCDGLGDCLPNCPTGAITFENREAPAYDEEAVKKSQSEKQLTKPSEKQPENEGKKEHLSAPGGCPGTRTMVFDRAGQAEASSVSAPGPFAGAASVSAPGGCPGSRTMVFDRAGQAEASSASAPGPFAGAAIASAPGPFAKAADVSGFSKTAGSAVSSAAAGVPACERPVSRLGQWPCQIKLLPAQAPFFDGAKILIAADCTAYAYANMHEDFMKGKVTLIGCPKLDAVDYSEKLTAIIRDNDVRSVTIVRMEVPCCGGLQRAAETALRQSGKFIPWQVVTISRDGRILDL